MKRSELNQIMRNALALIAEYKFALPPFVTWSMDEWQTKNSEYDEIKENMLGWDITDYGLDDFAHIGAVLYTVRNGNIRDASVGVPFCEKYILLRGGQRLTNHYHVAKTEDIINRAGGTLLLYLWNTDPATGKMLGTDVNVSMDGIRHTFRPGEEIRVEPGNSITLTPYLAHIFGAAPGNDLVVGEVSSINDDNTDNYFLEKTQRFATIEEDAPMLCPLCNEYDKVP